MAKRNIKSIYTGSAMAILSSHNTPWIKNPEERAKMTLACKDGEDIPRVKNAGKTAVIRGKEVQIMHNGLKVLKGAYQGNWQSKIIEGLKGIHEPQEEKVFYEVLKKIPPNSTILELGSWWSYYSMWFLKTIKNSKAYCCEPDPENLELGKANARLNSIIEGKGIFFRQYASGFQNNKKIKFKTSRDKIITVPIRSVDSIIMEEKISKLGILHMDIQGAELDALKGAQESIQKGLIRFLFVSTHHYSISSDPTMHHRCLSFIRKNGGYIIATHSIFESCSGDGLIVASFDKIDKDFTVRVSLQPVEDSFFRTNDLDLDILWKHYDKLRKMYLEIENQNKYLQIERNSMKEFINEVSPLSRHIKRQILLRIKNRKLKI